ncbi:MAG: hypothetical protein JJT75_14995 [Opitutales bacterium]|nr:hypothetical protein [Opitutales bacterium]
MRNQSARSSAPLSRQQKGDICRLAHNAWQHYPDHQIILDKNRHHSPSEVFRLWRHDQQRIACGCDSLTVATQEHYLQIIAHFRRLLKQYQSAATTQVRADTDSHRRAYWLLRKACAERGLDFPEYPGAICIKQCKVPLSQASEKQLMRLLYTVRNRRKPQK